MTVTQTPSQSQNAHPEWEVPDFIVTFFKMFPECVGRSRERHYAAGDGRCADCGQDSPCDTEIWVDKLYPKPPEGGVEAVQAGQPRQ